MQDRKQDRRNREEKSVEPEDVKPATAQSWKDRHGATLVAVGAGAILVAVIAFQMTC
jgi:hypothetical protein